MKIELYTTIPDHLSGQRLDQTLAQLFPQYSRAQHQTWIRHGEVTVDGQTHRPKDKIQTGQRIEIQAQFETETKAAPQDIPLSIAFEDEALLIVDKPAGLIVHPGAGHRDQTLLNALLHHDPKLEKLPRAGIIHRLDKETSGLLVVAKTPESYHALSQRMQTRAIKRQYEAIVQGVLISGGSIEAPVGRHPHQRTQMAVVSNGKPALTHYRVLEKFRSHTHLRIQLETGRTHQIRVHLSHLGYPIVGDKTYLKQIRFEKNSSETLKEAIRSFPRQALHATYIEFKHPSCSEELITVLSPLPNDIIGLLDKLKNDRPK